MLRAAVQQMRPEAVVRVRHRQQRAEAEGEVDLPRLATVMPSLIPSFSSITMGLEAVAAAPIEHNSRIHSICSSEYLVRNSACVAAPCVMGTAPVVLVVIAHHRGPREVAPAAAGEIHSTILSSRIAEVV